MRDSGRQRVLGEETYERLQKTLRSVELTLKGRTGPEQEDHPGDDEVTIRITDGPQLMEETYPDGKEKRYVYGGKFIYRDLDSLGIATEWVDYDELDCWAYEVNNADLAIGVRYQGRIVNFYLGRGLVEVDSSSGSSDCEANCFRNIDPATLTASMDTGACTSVLTYKAPQYCSPACVSPTPCGDDESSCSQCVEIYTATLNGTTGALLGVPATDGCTVDYTSSPKTSLRGCVIKCSEPSEGSIAIIDTTKPFYSTIDPDDCDAAPKLTFTIAYLQGAIIQLDCSDGGGGTTGKDFILQGRMQSQFVNLRSADSPTDTRWDALNTATLTTALQNRLDTTSPYYRSILELPEGDHYVVAGGVNISSLQSGLTLRGKGVDKTRLFGREPTLQTAIGLANGETEDCVGPLRFFTNGGASATVTGNDPSTQLGPVDGFRVHDPANGIYEVMMGAPVNASQIRDTDQWMGYPTSITVITPATETLPAKISVLLDRSVDASSAYQCRWFHDALIVTDVVGDTIELENTADTAFFTTNDYWLTDGAGINEVIGERVTIIRTFIDTGVAFVQLSKRVELILKLRAENNDTGNLCLIRCARMLSDFTLEGFTTGYLPGKGLYNGTFRNIKCRSAANAGINPTTCSGLKFENCPDLFGSLGPCDHLTFRNCNLMLFGGEEWNRHVYYDTCRIEVNYVAQVGAEWLTFFNCEFNGDTEGLTSYISIVQFSSGQKTNHVHLIECRINDNAYPIKIYGDHCKILHCFFAVNQGVEIDGLDGWVDGNVGGTITLDVNSTGYIGKNPTTSIIDGSGTPSLWMYNLTSFDVILREDGGLGYLWFDDPMIEALDGQYLRDHIVRVGSRWTDTLRPLNPEEWTITSNELTNVSPYDERRNIVFLPSGDVDWSAKIRTTTSGSWTAELLFNFQDDGNWWSFDLRASTVAFKQQLGAGTIADITTNSFSAANNTTYLVSVVPHGNTVNAYIDGVLVLTWTESTRPLKTARGFGVQTHSPSGGTPSAFFKEFRGVPSTSAAAGPWAGVTAVPIKGSATPAAKNLVNTLLGLSPALPLTDSTTTEIYLEDSFTGTTGTALASRALDFGGTWTKTGSGVYTIQSNKAELTTTSGGVTLLTADAGHADVIVEADLILPSSDGNVGLCCRFVDANNFIAVTLNDHSNANQITIDKNVSGTPSNVATFSYTLASSTTYKVGVSLIGNAYIVWVNGVVVGTATESAHNTATKFGLSVYDPFGPGQYDNFRVRAIPRPVPVDGSLIYGTVVATPIGSTLASGKIVVGNGSNIAADVTPSGVVSVSNSGVFSFSSSARVPQPIRVHYGTVNSVSTSGTFDTLYTSPVPANTLVNNGEMIKFEYDLTYVAQHTSDTRQTKVAFAGTNILDTTALAFTSVGAGRIVGTIVRHDATNARVTVQFNPKGLTSQPRVDISFLSGLDWTVANNLVLTAASAGTGAAADDIAAQMGNVTWWPAPATLPQSTFSLSLDGSHTGVATLTPPTGTMSLSFWIKTTSTSKSILGWDDNATATSTIFDRSVSINGAGKLTWFVYDGSGHTQTSDTVVNDNYWHHVMVTITAADGMDIYLDGTRQSTTIAGVTHGFNSYSTPKFIIGLNEVSSGFTGYLDDVTLWSSDKRSSAAGITAGTTDVASLSTDHLWRLDDGTGTTAVDTGAANFTLTSGTTWSGLVPPALA